jgi:hypothetical protein
MRSLHMVPQTDVSRHGTLTRVDQQKFCLQRGVNDASGPKVCRYNSNKKAVPADRESISETPRAVQVPPPESPW